MTKKNKHVEKAGAIAAMSTIANMIWTAAHEDGIDVGRAEEFRIDGKLYHLSIDVAIAGRVHQVLIMRPNMVLTRRGANV